MFMKAAQFFLACLLAATCASDADAQDPNAGSVLFLSASLPMPTPTVNFPLQDAQMPSVPRHERTARSDLSHMGGGVVREMRATSAFVEEHAATAETSDGWLMALVAVGLVVLQLRRKHLSLPQRRIAPYG